MVVTAVECVCDTRAKKALNAAFCLCSPTHKIQGRCSNGSRNKATLVTRDRLNQYIVSILNNSKIPTPAVSLLVGEEEYPVCRFIVRKINKELGTSTAQEAAANTNATVQVQHMGE